MMDTEEVLVADDAAMAPMYFEGETYLVRPAIKNVVNHRYGAGLDINWWKLEG
jgi:oligopeptide transport system substrate-binding protein